MIGSGIFTNAFWLVLAVAGGLVLVNVLIDVVAFPEHVRLGMVWKRLSRTLNRQKANTVTLPPR